MVILTYFFQRNQLSTHRLLFLISSKGSFICTVPLSWTWHTTAFDGPVVDPWLEWKITQTSNESTEQDWIAWSKPSQVDTLRPELCPALGWITMKVFLFFYALATYKGNCNIRTHGDFIVLPHWKIRLPAPWADIPLSHIIQRLSQPVHALS